MLIKQHPLDCQLRAHSLSAERNLIVGNSFTEDCFSDKYWKNFVTSCFPLSALLSSLFLILLQNFLILLRKNPNGKNLIMQDGYGKNSILSLCIVKLGKSQNACSPQCWEFWQVTTGRILHTTPLQLYLYEALLAKQREPFAERNRVDHSTAGQRRGRERDDGPTLPYAALCITEMSMTES